MVRGVSKSRKSAVAAAIAVAITMVACASSVKTLASGTSSVSSASVPAWETTLCAKPPQAMSATRAMGWIPAEKPLCPQTETWATPVATGGPAAVGGDPDNGVPTIRFAVLGGSQAMTVSPFADFEGREVQFAVVSAADAFKVPATAWSAPTTAWLGAPKRWVGKAELIAAGADVRIVVRCPGYGCRIANVGLAVR